MNTTKILISLRTAIFLLIVFFLGVASSWAIDLAAVEAEWTPPDSPTPITMWGFIADPGDCGSVPSPAAWDVAPLQTGTPGGDLTINLRNCLTTEPVSIIIPGQGLPSNNLGPVWTDNSAGARTPGPTLQRVRSFVHEAAPNGGTATYTWNNLKAGTFLYQSGSHPALQVHMGLYGALTVGTYTEAASEVLLIFSEIDPALHATQSTAMPLSYEPKYYLINGDTFSSADPVPVALAGLQTNNTVLLRMVNAGLMSHVPVLQGPHMQLVAEDGNPYPYMQNRYSVMLAAAKTIDAYWSPAKTGTYALYDRRLNLTSNGTVGGGMMVYLNVDIKSPFPWPAFVPAMTRGGVVK